MKIQKLVTLAALVIILSQCKKSNIDGFNIRPVYYDIPFEITTNDSFYLAEGPNSLGIRLISIYDDRATGILCSTTWGGKADITTATYHQNSTPDTCIKAIPGCSNNQEFDTLNPNTPKCIYQTYSLHLLKLSPYDKKETDVSKYSVKCVIKRQ